MNRLDGVWGCFGWYFRLSIRGWDCVFGLGPRRIKILWVSVDFGCPSIFRIPTMCCPIPVMVQLLGMSLWAATMGNNPHSLWTSMKFTSGADSGSNEKWLRPISQAHLAAGCWAPVVPRRLVWTDSCQPQPEECSRSPCFGAWHWKDWTLLWQAALANRRVGSLSGTTGLDWTKSCFFLSTKNLM